MRGVALALPCSSACARALDPEGAALSVGSLGRRTSRSASSPVSKKPPDPMEIARKVKAMAPMIAMMGGR